MRLFFAALLLWLSLASSASADISFVSGADLGPGITGNGNTVTASFTVSSSANRILVVFAFWNQPGDAITLTYNGVTMAGPFANTGQASGFYILVNPASGSNTLSFTNASSSTGFMDMQAAEYAGAAQTGQPDTTGTNTTDSIAEDTYSTTVGPTVADRAWIIGEVVGGGGGTPPNSMSAPFTGRINDGTGNFKSMGDSGTITPAGTATFAATMQNSGSAQIHFSFSIAPAPTVGTLVPLTPGTIFCQSILARLANCHAALVRSVGEVYA